MYMPLDAYEQELIDAVEANAFVPASIDEERLRMLKDAARKKMESMEVKNRSL